MSGLYMPAGDPQALNAAAASLRGYAGQIATLSASTRSTTDRVVANADWTGSSADAYTAFTADFSTRLDNIQEPLRGIPGAVAGYSAALANAQAKVTSYQSFAERVNSSTTPVTVQEKSAILAQAQQLTDEAETALADLERQADNAARLLKGIGKVLDDVFGSEGPVRTWLENITRPWDSAGADAILESFLQRGEKLTEEFKEAKEVFDKVGETAKSAKADIAAELNATLDSDFKEIVGTVMKDMLAGKANLSDLAAAVGKWQVVAQWTKDGAAASSTAVDLTAQAVDAPEKSALLKLYPYLQKLGMAADALGIVGGTYTAISPPDYDTGGTRFAARVAGGGLALGSAAGLAGGLAEAGVLGTGTADFLAAGVVGSLTIPGVGEVVAAGAGLYLVGDWAYHNTHTIAHTFDSARHTAAHYADDLTSWL